MKASALQESMERAIRKSRDESEDHRMMIKKKKVDFSSSLTDDTLFDILRRLPAVVLRYKTRFVCRKWFKIITYRILKDHASFIIQRSSEPYTACQVTIREEKQGLELEQHYLDIPSIGRIKSWCNEFLLIADPYRTESLYVFNLLTNKGLYLPFCNTSCGGHFTSRCGVALAFDGFKGVYKAIHIFMGPPIQCKIIVLKRDITTRVSSKWKSIKMPCCDMGEGKHYWGNPVSVQGRYFHWEVPCSNYLVSMDMVKEKFFQIPLPECEDDDEYRRNYSFVEMGGFLALVDNVSWNQTDLWILKDFQMMKWEKLHSIRFPKSCVNRGIDPPIFRSASPVCSVISKRYLIFKSSRTKPGELVSYDLESQVTKELIRCEAGEHCVVHSAAPSFR